MSLREPTLELPVHVPNPPDSAEQDIRAMLAAYRQSGKIDQADRPNFEDLGKRNTEMVKFRMNSFSVKDFLVASVAALALLSTGIIIGLIV